MNHNSQEKSNTDGLVDVDSHNVDSPLVSVIIATYNSATTIGRTIESVINQTYSNYEIIVVDDGSTDNTRAVLDSYIVSGAIAYYYQNNAGCGAARNYGVNQSKGELLAFLDADDYWHVEKLSQQVAVMQANSDVIVCYTETYVIDPYSHVIWEIKRTTINKPRSGWIGKYLLFHNAIPLSTTLIRRESFESVNGFTEAYDLMMYADFDLWLRLAPRGKFYAITTPLAYYQLRPPQGLVAAANNTKKAALVFKRNIKKVPILLGVGYYIGWVRYSLQSCLYRLVAFLKSI